MPTQIPPQRWLLLAEQWRQGRNRYAYPFEPAARDAALEQAQREADRVPGKGNLIVLQSWQGGVYVDDETLRPGEDGRFLPPEADAEEGEEAPQEVTNPILAGIARVAAESRGQDSEG